MEALKSCSLTGTPDVATAQQGLKTSIDPLITVCSAPFPPTTYKEEPFSVVFMGKSAGLFLRRMKVIEGGTCT